MFEDVGRGVTGVLMIVSELLLRIFHIKIENSLLIRKCLQSVMLRAVIHVVSASVNSAALSFDLSRSDFHLIKDTEQNRGNKLLRIIILISSFLGVKNEQK